MQCARHGGSRGSRHSFRLRRDGRVRHGRGRPGEGARGEGFGGLRRASDPGSDGCGDEGDCGSGGRRGGPGVGGRALAAPDRGSASSVFLPDAYGSRRIDPAGSRNFRRPVCDVHRPTCTTADLHGGSPGRSRSLSCLRSGWKVDRRSPRLGHRWIAWIRSGSAERHRGPVSIASCRPPDQSRSPNPCIRSVLEDGMGPF